MELSGLGCVVYEIVMGEVDVEGEGVLFNELVAWQSVDFSNP